MLLVLGAIVVLGGAAAVVLLAPGGAGGWFDQPHRVAGGQPAAPDNGDSPRWDTPGHRWVALTEAWAVPQVDESPHAYGLASDGQHVFALRKPIGNLGQAPDADAEAELTAYDAATGEQLWRKKLPWIQDAAPVGSDGIIIIPGGKQTGGESANDPGTAEYIALDSETGAERWRVQVDRRVLFEGTISRPQGVPVGAVLDGVFYYGDGPALTGVDVQTGEIHYQVTSEKNVIVAGPVVAGGRITVIAEPPFDPADPSYVRTAFMFTPDLTSQVGSSFPEHASPSAITASGDIFVAWGGNVVWATDARTGRGLWSKASPVLSGIVDVLGNVIVVHDGRDHHAEKVLGYDLMTGDHLWTTNPPNNSGYESDGTNVGIADGTLFAMSHSFSIVDATDGEVLFTQPTVRGGGVVASGGGHIVIYNADGITGYR